MDALASSSSSSSIAPDISGRDQHSLATVSQSKQQHAPHTTLGSRLPASLIPGGASVGAGAGAKLGPIRKTSTDRLLHQLEQGLGPQFSYAIPSQQQQQQQQPVSSHSSAHPAPASPPSTGPPPSAPAASLDQAWSLSQSHRRMTASSMGSVRESDDEGSPPSVGTPAMTPDLTTSSSDLSLHRSAGESCCVTATTSAAAVPAAVAAAAALHLASSSGQLPASHSFPNDSTGSTGSTGSSNTTLDSGRPSLSVRPTSIVSDVRQAFSSSSSVPSFGTPGSSNRLPKAASAQSYSSSPAPSIMVPMLTTSSPEPEEVPASEPHRSQPEPRPDPVVQRPASDASAHNGAALASNSPSPGHAHHDHHDHGGCSGSQHPGPLVQAVLNNGDAAQGTRPDIGRYESNNGSTSRQGSGDRPNDPQRPDRSNHPDRPDRGDRDPNRKPRDKSHSRITFCAGCGKRMSGQFVRALGQVYHLDCFCCRDCGVNVASKFFPNGPDNKTGEKYALCERDYFRRLGLICANCGNALRGSYITALNKKFHIEHFTCSLCDVVFGPHDSYYEHAKKVYCHFHYSTRFAVACEGCKTAILRQFVEFVRNGHTETWHPECYMINKFWNVKLASDSPGSSGLVEIGGQTLGTNALTLPTNDDEANATNDAGVANATLQRALQIEATETPQSLKAKQIAMEERVLRIWNVLSNFEDSSASCISAMQRSVAAGNYLLGINMADQFVFHVEVLFAAIDKLEERSRELNPEQHEDEGLVVPTDQQLTPNDQQPALPAPPGQADLPKKPAGLIPLREARMLCKRIVNFFSILSRPPSDRATENKGPTILAQELSPLITGMAQYLKMLIRIALMGALQLNDHAAFDKFLDQLDRLNKMTKGKEDGTRGQDLPVEDVPPKESEGKDIGCGYTTIPRDTFWRSSESGTTRPGGASTDLCAFCHQTVEEECFALRNKTRWHLSCFRCENCTRPTTNWVPKKPRSTSSSQPSASPQPSGSAQATADAHIASFTKSIEGAPEAWPVEEFGVETRRWTSSKCTTPPDLAATSTLSVVRTPTDTILPPVPPGSGPPSQSSSPKPSHSTSYRALCSSCEICTAATTIHGVVRISRLEQYTFLLRVALTRLFFQLKRRGVIYSTPLPTLIMPPSGMGSTSPSPGGTEKFSSDYLSVGGGTGALTRSSTAGSSTSATSIDGNVRRRIGRSNLSLDRKMESKAKQPHISTIVRGPTGKSTGVDGATQVMPSPQPPTVETPSHLGGDYFSQPMGTSRSALPSGAGMGRDKLLPPPVGRRSVSPASAGGSSLTDRSISTDRADKMLPRPPVEDKSARPPFARTNTEVQIQEAPLGDRLNLSTLDPDKMALDDVTNQLEFVPDKDISMPFVAAMSSEQRLVLKCMALACLATEPSADGDKLDDPLPNGVGTPEMRSQLNLEDFLNAEDFLVDPSEPRKGNFWGKLFQKPKANHKRGGGAIFGVPLQTLVITHGSEIMSTATQTNIKVPALLDEVIRAIRYLDPSVEGIFRKNGNIRKLKEVSDLMDRGGTFKSSMLNDNVIQLAAFLKRFLRELPDPLLTFRLYPLFMATQELESEQDRIRALRYVTLLLPTPHRDTMEELFTFIKWVANFEKIDGESGSRMDLLNLSTVLGPNLLYARPNANAGPEDRSTALPANDAVLLMLQHQDLLWLVPPEFKAPLDDPELLSLAESGNVRELLRKCMDKYLLAAGMSSQVPQSTLTPPPAPGLSRTLSNAGRIRGKTIASPEASYPSRTFGHQSSSSLAPQPPFPQASHPPFVPSRQVSPYPLSQSNSSHGGAQGLPLGTPGSAEPMSVSLSHSAVPMTGAGASLAASIMNMHQGGLSTPNLRQHSGLGTPSQVSQQNTGGSNYPLMPPQPARTGSSPAPRPSSYLSHGEPYRVRSSSPSGTRTQSPRPSSLSSHGHSGQSHMSPTASAPPATVPGIPGVGAMPLVPGSLVPGSLVTPHHASPHAPPPSAYHQFSPYTPPGGNFAGVGAAASPRLGPAGGRAPSPGSHSAGYNYQR